MAVEVIIRGKNNTVKLSDSHFVASGGQGDVYKHSGTIYKIYHNPSEMIPDVKIKELKAITDKHVLIPNDILLDKSGQVIGFTMPFVNNSIPLCKLFTNSFRNKNNIGPEMTLSLVQTMQQIISNIHNAHCLQVDGNEFNYLTGDDFKTPYFIDTDSYQTPSYPATVIMPTIRDYKSQKFSELTDWFSFGIISFQLFVGIHPFRGGHQNYTNADLAKRIIDCISVFNKDVSVPNQARDFNANIPTAYRDWYMAMFERGERLLPPTDAKNYGVKTTMNTIIQSTSFDFMLKKQMSEEVLFYATICGNTIIKTIKSIYINNQPIPDSKDCELCFTIKNNIPLLINIENVTLNVKSLNKNIYLKYDLPIMAQEIMVFNNFVYVKYEDTIKEIDFTEIDDYIIPNVRKTLAVMSGATQMFSNIIYQNMFGKSYFTIPEPNKNLINSLFIKELDGYKIVDAKYLKNVAVIIGNKNGVYDRFLIVFKDDFSQYVYRVDKDINYDSINFVALDKGTCILSKDDVLQLFMNKYSTSGINVKQISASKFNQYPLCHEGNQLLFIRGCDIIQATMKSQN